MNRISSHLLGKTRYELLFYSKPDYDHLHVLGGLYYASASPINRNKFDTQARVHMNLKDIYSV